MIASLTEMQLDILKETFNMGVGQAAMALSEIAHGEEIELSVPYVELKSVNELETQVRETAGNDVCGVSEAFSGPFEGRAMILYSQEESLELVKIMLGETIPVEQLSEMEGEALCEVGNIVLNACISALANLLGDEISTEVPNLQVGGCREVISKSLGLEEDSRILHLRMNFSLSKYHLNGHIGFFLDVTSLSALKDYLDAYFQKMMEGG